jgi:hypothetical protein
MATNEYECVDCGNEAGLHWHNPVTDETVHLCRGCARRRWREIAVRWEMEPRTSVGLHR